MERYDPRIWLKQQVETAVEMSPDAPGIAVWGVVLTLPGDVAETLKRRGAIYGFAGETWFDYENGGTTVCVPIKIQNG